MRRFIFDLIFPRAGTPIGPILGEADVKGRGCSVFCLRLHARGCPRNRNTLLVIWVREHVDPYSGRHPPVIGKLGQRLVCAAPGHAKPCVASWLPRSCSGLSTLFREDQTTVSNRVVYRFIYRFRIGIFFLVFFLSFLSLFKRSIKSVLFV